MAAPARIAGRVPAREKNWRNIPANSALDRTGGLPTVPGEWADSAGHAAGGHSSGPTMNLHGERSNYSSSPSGT